jgi:hypothetical protein
MSKFVNIWTKIVDGELEILGMDLFDKETAKWRASIPGEIKSSTSSGGLDPSI